MALLDPKPDSVSIYEVGPRNGLQNEAATVGAVRKLRLVASLVASGLQRIEITGFASAKTIPQLADADELAKLLSPQPEGVHYSALVPNAEGLERAVASGLTEIAVIMSTSETHNRRTLQRGIEDTMSELRTLVPAAIERGLRVRGYVATAWGCPFEGHVDALRTQSFTSRLLQLGCYEVALTDNIGVATAHTTRELLDFCLEEISADKLAMHMYDSRGQALTNILVGLESGVRSFDTSIAGLGQNAFVAGAVGNLATEDLVYMLDREGIQCGVDLAKLFEAGRVAEAAVGRELPGRVHKAGLQSLAG